MIGIESSAAPSLSGHPLVRSLLDLGLDRRDFVVFGSGPLLAHGIRTNLRDLDVVATRQAWERVRSLGSPMAGEISGAPMRRFCDGRIHICEEWISGLWDTEDLIDQADVIDGIRFAPLTDVLDYKRMLMRPKDVSDIALVTEHLESVAEWGWCPVCASFSADGNSKP
jgi:hypothetical protein